MVRPLLHSSGVTASAVDDVAQTIAPTEAAQPVAATRKTTPRHVVHTMSMDAPIQGGLTARQEQALSAKLIRAHRTPATAPKSAHWTPAMGRSAVALAKSWLGMPYSWAGGSNSGPTAGRCDPGSGGDLDCHVVGFDCSGLMMYAWGAYVSLPHLAADQRNAGAFHPSVEQLMPGDLVFFSAYIVGGTGHVGIYIGNGMVIEAPQSGSVVQRTSLAEMMASDGVYRGAVRPMSGPTPTLTKAHLAVPTKGGTVTLRGAHLADVTAVRVGGVIVHRFTRRSDSAIVFHAPGHRSGTVAVTVVTSWNAPAKSVALAYVRPHHNPVTPKPRPRPSSSAPSTSKPAAPGSPKPSAPSTSKPAPAPTISPNSSTKPSMKTSPPSKSVTTKSPVA